jgi:hypothetical protein
LSTNHYNEAETVAAIKHARRAEDSRYFQAKILQKNGEYVDIDDLARKPPAAFLSFGGPMFGLGFLSTGHFEKLPEFCVGIHLGDYPRGTLNANFWGPLGTKSFVLLVVGEVSEGKWERIGIARELAYNYYESLDRSWKTLYIG